MTKVLARLIQSSFLAVSTALSAAPDMAFLDWVNSAQTALGEGRNHDARDNLERATTQALRESNPRAVAIVNVLLGTLFERTGDTQQALIAYEAALTALAGGPRQGDERLKGALAELQQTHKAYRGTGSVPPVSVDLYRAGLPPLEQVLERPEGGQRLAFVATLNAGNLYLLQSQYAQAELLYRQALKLTERHGRQERSQVHTNLAWSALKRGDLIESQTHLDAALTAGGNEPGEALRRVLLAKAVDARERGDVKSAIAGLEKAVEVYHAAGQGREEARALAHLGTAYLAARRNEAAIRAYSRALVLNDALRDGETEWHVRGGLARARQRAGDLTGALAEYQAYIAVVERVGEGFRTDQGRVSFLENQNDFLEDYLRAAIARAVQTGDFALAHQAAERVRERTLRDLVTAPPGPLLLKPGELYPRDVFPAYAVTNFPGGAQVQMAPAIEIRTYGEAPRRDGVPPEHIAPPPLPIAGPTNPAVGLRPITWLEYFVLSDRTLVLVKGPTGRIDGAVAPYGAKRLEQMIEAYRRAMDVERGRGVVLTLASSAPLGTADTGTSNAAERLYRELIRPIERHLPRDGTHSVVIVPHRALWLLPFAALRAPDGVYFGDRYLVSYSPAESIWLNAAGAARPDFRSSPAWVFGNPHIPASLRTCQTTFEFQPLPGAEAEARAIAAEFGPDRSEVFLGEQADGLRLRAWHPALGVLHLATHGVACSEEPLDSFLVLTALSAGDVNFDPVAGTLTRPRDGRRSVTLRDFHPEPGIPAPEVSYPGLLTARTVAKDFRLNADLVTLSACQTGLGKALGQGNIGFTRAFLAAGARSVLASLWRVDDDATGKLMRAFYSEYLDHGNKALALQRAMQAVRRDHPAPRYWAAFTLVGAAE